MRVSQDSRGIQQRAATLAAMSLFLRRSANTRLQCIAVLAAMALASGASAADAFVGRASASTVRERVIELVNAARDSGRRCGSQRFSRAPPLSASSKLTDAAAGHARDMARKKYFDHRGSDGRQPKDRVLRAGYQPRLTGENIAFGPESAEEVVAGWLASPGHCSNIMDARFQDIGVSFSTGRDRRQIYWVQTFGAPR